MDERLQARTAIDAVLQRLTELLGPVVEAELRPRYRGADDWLAQATRRPGRRPTTASIDDPADLLSAMIGTWDTVWSRRAQRRETRSHLHELRTVRNRWAHHEPLDLDDARRLADTAGRVLTSLGYPEHAAELRALAPTGPATGAAPAVDTTTSTPAGTPPTLVQLRAGIAGLLARIDDAAAALLWATGPEDRPAIRDQLERWGDELHRLRQASAEVPAVTITLLGSSGAGKSTLINALLGERTMASLNTRACTSAVVEVGYDPDAYRAEITFIDRAAWREELAGYVAEIGAEPAGGRTRSTIGGEVERKLRALYDDTAIARLVEYLDPDALDEPALLTEVFETGRQELTAASGEQLRLALKDHVTSDGRLWPLVQLVRVRGPFAALAAGGVLVDLPGLNDPNASREAVTRRYLDDSRYVWVVFDMRRALNRDVTDALRERDLFRRLVMEGREGALVFVGTRSDDIDLDVDGEELGLGADASAVEIATERNARTAANIRIQLGDLVDELERAGEHRSDLLRSAVAELPVFTVSPHNLLVQRGIMRSHHPPVFTDEELTGIPALVEHLEATAGDVHVAAHVRQLTTELGVVRDEITAALRSARTGKALGELATPRGRLAADAAEATAELTTELRRVQLELRDALESSRTEFLAQLRAGIERAGAAAEPRIRADLGGYHWASLRRACRGAGTALSPTAGRIDLTREVGRSLYDSVALTWAGFFGERLRDDVQREREQVQRALGAYRDRLEAATPAAVRADPATAAAVSALHEVALGAVTHGVQAMVAEIERRITETRRELLGVLDSVLGEGLAEAYALAGQEKGAGTKQRIVDRLADAGRRCLAEVGPQLVDDIAVGLDDLLEWTAERFADLADDAAERTGAVVVQLQNAADQRQRLIEQAWREQLELIHAG